MEVARQAIPAYSSKYSKKDFTQHQLIAILALEQFFKTDDRGIVVLLCDLLDLKNILGLTKIPHHTTLFHARQRLAKKGALRTCSDRSSWMLSGVD
ncbi:MAG TPA: transposase [Tepidisphaeraceae bacterium]|nr:transposase [Tepidisphaeraceae bacterium]